VPALPSEDTGVCLMSNFSQVFAFVLVIEGTCYGEADGANFVSVED